MKFAAAVLIALSPILAGCAPSGGDAGARAIAPGDSPLSIDGAAALGARYDQLRSPTHTTTNVEFHDGSIIYEVSGTTTMFGRTNDRATRQIDRVVAPHLAELGIVSDRASLRRGRVDLGEYTMIAATGLGRECWMFELYPDAQLQFFDNGGFYKAYLAGFICARPGGTRDAAEAATRRLLDALHLDNGALNRAQTRR